VLAREAVGAISGAVPLPDGNQRGDGDDFALLLQRALRIAALVLAEQ